MQDPCPNQILQILTEVLVELQVANIRWEQAYEAQLPTAKSIEKFNKEKKECREALRQKVTNVLVGVGKF